MTQEHKTVFISYRRDVASFIARAVFQDLRKHRFDVFMDVESIDSGTFDTIILNQIEARAHFLVILTSGTLYRCADSHDWLRREIEYAIDKERNIVPILVHGFSFDADEKYLTGKLDQLKRFNGLPLMHEYFDEGMKRLRTRFLKQPIYGKIRPTPASDEPMVQQKISEAAAQPPPTRKELSAEEYFIQGIRKVLADDGEGAIADLNNALRLTPQNAGICYYWLGQAHHGIGNIVEAIDDYTNAIRSDPSESANYRARGRVYFEKSDMEHAVADYSEAIHLDQEDADAYEARAEAHFVLGDYEQALSDFERGYELDESDKAYAGVAITRYKLGQKRQAVEMWFPLVDEDDNYWDAEWVGKEFDWARPLIDTAERLIDAMDVYQ